MRPETEAWVEDAEYDLQSARVMLDSGRYFFVVFMCHLTIEKLLKSVIVERQGLEPRPLRARPHSTKGQWSSRHG